MPPLRPNEEWARRTIQQTLDVPVRQNDDQSEAAMHDLTIEYEASEAAVEVTAVVDDLSTELWTVAYRDGRWEEPGLAGGWSVHIDPTRRRRKSKLRRDLPLFLAELEKQHIRHYPSVARTALDGLAHEMGVARAHQGDTDYAGSIYVSPELPADQYVGFASQDGNVLSEWASTFLQGDTTADLRAKLARSGASERHAFLIVGTLPGVPFSVSELLVREDAPLPIDDPALPDEVTDVWIVSTWSAGHGFYWSAARGWMRFEKAGPERTGELPRDK